VTARHPRPCRPLLDEGTARIVRAYGEPVAEVIRRAVLMLAMADGRVDTRGRVIVERVVARGGR
jgi:hypothetical protein